MRYMLKRSLVENEFRGLLRVHDDGRQELWTPTGWESWSDMSWTGIGGDVDWQEVTQAEAVAAVAEIGYGPETVVGR